MMYGKSVICEDEVVNDCAMLANFLEAMLLTYVMFVKRAIFEHVIRRSCAVLKKVTEAIVRSFAIFSKCTICTKSKKRLSEARVQN